MTDITGTESHEELVGTENDDTILGLSGRILLQGVEADTLTADMFSFG